MPFNKANNDITWQPPDMILESPGVYVTPFCDGLKIHFDCKVD